VFDGIFLKGGELIVEQAFGVMQEPPDQGALAVIYACLLYTSDAADDM
jgi:hypothetical protein